MIAAVLLAAGGSSRMGRAKQSLRYRGRTLLRHSVDAASDGGCDPVVVVLGCGADDLRTELAGLPVTIAVNERWNEGIGGSVRRGVETVISSSQPVDGVLLMLCDQPQVTADVVRRVRESYDGRAGRCVACEYAGTVGPPAIFDRSWFGHLLRLEGDRGAKPVLVEAGDLLVRVPWPEGAVEINRPEDYDTLLDLDTNS